jgi:hypothetical protein
MASKTVLFLDSCYAGAALNIGKPSGAKTVAAKEVPESFVAGSVNDTPEMPGGAGASGANATSNMIRLIADFSTAGTGAIVFAASNGRECAAESDKWDNHSAFSKALIEAVGEGKASTDSSGLITLTTLDLYIEKRVKELTVNLQHPVMYRPNSVRDFPIALARP